MDETLRTGDASTHDERVWQIRALVLLRAEDSPVRSGLHIKPPDLTTVACIFL